MSLPVRNPKDFDPDLTPDADQTAANEDIDIRRLTAGYDPLTVGDSPETEPEPALPLTDETDDGTIDTDTGMDFGVGGGRDVGTDLDSEILDPG